MLRDPQFIGFILMHAWQMLGEAVGYLSKIRNQK